MTAMTDPMRNFVERFPASKDVICELRDTNSAFDALCEEYAMINDKLDALTREKGAEALARANALRERRMAIEEELLTEIEGYRLA
jgi:uncharacterized protein YdcH (DUF465 family)